MLYRLGKSSKLLFSCFSIRIIKETRQENKFISVVRDKAGVEVQVSHSSNAMDGWTDRDGQEDRQSVGRTDG